MKLNVGCGTTKFSGFINIDINPDLKPDVVADARESLPFDDNSVDTIWFIHTIEHIEDTFHTKILVEFRRVLKDGGDLVIAYPEFIKCAQNYIENKWGKRKFWKQTLYGRQCFKSDYHVALMNSEEFKGLLEYCGFYHIQIGPDPKEPYNTFVKARKGPLPDSREDILRREIFGD